MYLENIRTGKRVALHDHGFTADGYMIVSQPLSAAAGILSSAVQSALQYIPRT
jgi:hypothetical protein